MKWMIVFLTTAMLLSGCHKEETGLIDNTAIVTYSNLNDEESRELLEELMIKADISREKRESLFEHIDQFNEVMTQDQMTCGFEDTEVNEMKYDAYDLADQWNSKYPDFVGYCCRITAFSLIQDQIRFTGDLHPDEYAVMMDMDALNTDPGVLSDKMEQYQFFYSPVETEMTRDIETHVEILQKSWKDRGIVFTGNEHVSLISVIFHNDIDDPSVLETGHTGLLFSDEGQLYFLEKLAFQEPYQLIRLNDRKELQQILLQRYDISYGQKTASVFIMENDQRMKV